MEMLAIAGLVFLGIHIVPATPLRRTVVAAIGEGPYMALFSLVSLIVIWWWVRAFNATAPDAGLWTPPNWWPWIMAVVLLAGAVLFVGGLSSPNPTLPNRGALLERPGVAQGIFAVTRHPLMWSFGLWGAAHLISQSNWRGFWFFGLFALTAIGGAVAQEWRKSETYGASWDRFTAKTSFVPMLAVLQGRARFSMAEIGWWRIGVAVLLWAILLFLHPWLFGVAPLPGLI